MNYLTRWVNEMLARESMTVDSRIEVEGVVDRHLGPRFELAKIRLIIEPSIRFEVVLSSIQSESIEAVEPMVEAAIFGLLDVLLVADPLPVKNIKVTVQAIEIDPVDSSAMAFRKAGRDAARQVLTSIGIE